MSYLFDLTGKTALVTGGANGIGLACAKALAEAGCSLLLADYDKQALDAAVNDCRSHGWKVQGLFCDVASSESVAAMAAAAKQAGGVDILVNSAAVTNRKTLVEMTEAEWDRIITTNLYGAYRVGKAVAQLMIEQGRSGRMIFIVSTGAYRAGVNFGAYSASKAGVVMLMKTFALELAPHGILCNAIAPTATDTNFTADYYQQFPEKKEAVIKNHPLGRIARAEDYQGTVVYLASKAAEFVTGTMLVVDGGKTAK